MFEAEIKFKCEPIKNHEMQYKCDERKDRCIQGRNRNKYPVVKITDSLCRAGILKVVSVSHVQENGAYSLHPNLLTNDRNGTKFCDEYGVASYKFTTNRSGEALVELKNIAVRHAKKDEVVKIKQNWVMNKNAFDPYKTGFCLSKFDLQRVRLCCQAVFMDSYETTPIVSDVIFNGCSDLKIEFWDDNLHVNVNGGDKVYVLVLKLTADQRKVYGKVFDNENWESDEMEPIHSHHDHAFVFEMPAYKTNELDEPVECKFQLLVEDRDYCSELKTFKYISGQSMFKRSFREAFEDDDEEIDFSPNTSASSESRCNLHKKSRSDIIQSSCNALINNIMVNDQVIQIPVLNSSSSFETSGLNFNGASDNQIFTTVTENGDVNLNLDDNYFLDLINSIVRDQATLPQTTNENQNLLTPIDEEYQIPTPDINEDLFNGEYDTRVSSPVVSLMDDPSNVSDSSSINTSSLDSEWDDFLESYLQSH